MQKSIRRKLIIYIVPIIAFILFLGCTFIVLNSKKIIQQEIYQSLLSRQVTRFNDIELKASEIKGTVDSFSSNIKNTYAYLDNNTYDKILKETLNTNTKLQSIALWFEPYVIDPNEEYANAFVERDDITLSNNEYYNAGVFDYLNHELYIQAKEKNESFFTEPYYNSQMDSYIAVYITPIQNEDGEFIGCITASFKLNELKTYIDAFAYDSINFYIVDDSGKYVALY